MKATHVLCIDAGNTQVKWCFQSLSAGVFAPDEPVCSHETLAFKPFDACLPLLRRLLPALQGEPGKVGAVLLSNVLGEAFEASLRAFCNEFALEVLPLVVSGNPVVASLYENTQSLGKDRWAACLAVAEISDSPVNVVVSFGTATTIDVLLKQATWQHQGGYIVPGVHTMLGSLHANTAELPQVTFAGQGVVGQALWPVNTGQAIGQGVARMQAAMVQSVCAQLQQQHGQAPALWLTGGHALAMQAHFNSARLLEHAVFRGLLFDYRLRKGALS